MASTAALNYITLQQLLNCGYAMVAITSSFAVVRIGIRLTRPKALAAEDVLVALSFACFLTMTSLYISIAPILFRLSDVISGKKPPYATLEEDALSLIRVFFANTLLLWCVLWLVKGSLLSLYWKLLGSKRLFRWIWWGIAGFCVVTFIGCVASHLTSCSSIHAWFTPGACATPRDERAQIISLYYAFAVDVMSDLMVMGLPIALIWNLKLPMAKKLGIGALFCVGIIAVAAAVVRVVSIGVRAGTSTPSSSWLAFWGIIEAGIAVIIGTAPGLYTTARRAHSSWKESKYIEYRDGSGADYHTGQESLNTPQVNSQPSKSKNISSELIDEDDDERAIFQTRDASILRPTYLKPTKASGRDFDQDMEMSAKDEWGRSHIQVTKQFTVSSESRKF